MATFEITNIAAALDKFEIEEGRDFLDQMLQIFNKRIPSDISEMEDALQNKDIETLKKKAHLIAGSMSSFMLSEGNQLASSLEKECNNNNTNAIISKTENLILYLNVVLNYIAQNYEA